MGKISIRDVKLLFDKFGCALLSEKYINAKSKLTFRCSCGRIDDTTYDSFKHREHKMCKKCAKKKSSSKKKHSFEFVKKSFDDNGCILLSTSYINNSTPLNYICECGTESSITFASFLEGRRCKKCWYRKVSDSNSFDYEYVKSVFEGNNCKLLESTYVTANTNMRYICECGNESVTTFSRFKAGARCRECGTRKTSEANRRSIEEIVRIVEKENCRLITNEYINTKQKLDMICTCGNNFFTTIELFENGSRCKECNYAKLRFSYEYVKHYFEENGCTLLTEEYKRSDQNLDYICSCGRMTKTQFYRFKYGQRCMKCRDEKYNIGENSHAWKGGITSLSNYVRGKMTEWKQETEIACGYKCAITNHEVYDAHHIFGFSTIFNEAIELLNFPINESVSDYSKHQLDTIVDKTVELHNKYGVGVCLREDIHYDFHKEYGFENNNLNQFLEFIKYNYPHKLNNIEKILNLYSYSLNKLY